MGCNAIEQHAAADFPVCFPRLYCVDHIVHGTQQRDGSRIAGRVGVSSAAHPFVDTLVSECGKAFGTGGAVGAVGAGGVAIGFLDPCCSVGMRQVMDADAVLGPYGHHLVGMTLHAGMDGAAKTDGAAAEQADMVLRPVIGTLIMRAQDVVA